MPTSATRYQVFVSSTVRDLEPERLSAYSAISLLGQIPTGLEIWPASGRPPWDVIQRSIELSDYYVVIVAGRYGSLTTEGISWTEREYELAVSLDLPVLPFLHAKPDDIPRKFTDDSPELIDKLQAFRERLQDSHTSRDFSDPVELQTLITASLAVEMTTHPGLGWVRNAGQSEIELLRENSELRKSLAKRQTILAASSGELDSDASSWSPDSEVDLYFRAVRTIGTQAVLKYPSIKATIRIGDLIQYVGTYAVRNISEHSVRLDMTRLIKRQCPAPVRAPDGGFSVAILEESWNRVRVLLGGSGMISLEQEGNRGLRFTTTQAGLKALYESGFVAQSELPAQIDMGEELPDPQTEEEG